MNISPKEAWKAGKFLKKNELENIWKSLLKDLKKLMKRFEKKPSEKKAKLFQKLLVTLCLFASLGQRKQVWVTLETKKIYLDTFSLNGNNSSGYWKMLLTPEKVSRPSYIDGIVIPEYLAKLLVYFENEVRSYLNPISDEVCSMWINSEGEPLGPKRFTFLVTTTIKRYYPNKKITPAIIRRIMASHLVNEMQDQDFQKQKQETLLLEFSNYINTGIRMLEKFYNRAQQGHSASKTQNSVQEIVLDTPSSQNSQQTILENLNNSFEFDNIEPVYHGEGNFCNHFVDSCFGRACS